tara:strand:+ start:220 stop:465 length:246 start_codon:yes stop_codon:yes gene_type:complete
MFVIIDSEFRSLIKYFLQKFIGLNFKKKYNKNQELLLKLSIRVISSLLAIYIFNNVKNIKNIKENISYIMIIIFLYFAINE